MIIDAHAHVFAFPKLILTAESGCHLSPEQLIEIMDRKGIDKAVIQPLSNAEVPIESQGAGEVLDICEKYPERFIPFCNFDPRVGLNPEKIMTKDYIFRLEQYKRLGCKGFGELTARLPFDDRLLLMLFEACQELELPVCFHTITKDYNWYGTIDDIGLPRLEKALKRFPKLKFLGHSPGFWSEINGDVSEKDKNGYSFTPIIQGGALPRLLRKYPNLYGDLSAESGINALIRDQHHAWKFIEEFQDRLLLGLDYCFVADDRPHIEWLTKAKNDKNISPQAYEKIMYKNAIKVLNINM